MDPDRRMLRLETFHVLSHVAQADRVNGGDADRARQLSVGRPDGGLQLDVLLQQGVTALVVSLAKRGQL